MRWRPYPHRWPAVVGDERQGAIPPGHWRLPGAIIPLITGTPDTARVMLERHLCVDTTAAGGNASLLLSSSE